VRPNSSYAVGIKDAYRVRVFWQDQALWYDASLCETVEQLKKDIVTKQKLEDISDRLILIHQGQTLADVFEISKHIPAGSLIIVHKFRVIENDEKAYYTSDLVENIRFTFQTTNKTVENTKLLMDVFKEL
jgi:hypothetical protein